MTKQNQTKDLNIVQKGCGGLFLFIFIFPFSIFSILGLSTFVFHSSQVIFAQCWVAMPANIESIDTLYRARTRISRSGDSGATKVEISYIYEYKNVRYKGSSLYFGATYGNRRSGNYELYQKLKPANQIRVYVNPISPNKSVIIRGFTNEIFENGIMGLIFGLVPSIFFIPKLLNTLSSKSIKYLGLGIILCLFFFSVFMNSLDMTQQVLILK